MRVIRFQFQLGFEAGCLAKQQYFVRLKQYPTTIKQQHAIVNIVPNDKNHVQIGTATTTFFFVPIQSTCFFVAISLSSNAVYKISRV